MEAQAIKTKPDLTRVVLSQLAIDAKSVGVKQASQDIVDAAWSKYGRELGEAGRYNLAGLKDRVEQHLRVASSRLNEGIAPELLREPTEVERENLIETGRRSHSRGLLLRQMTFASWLRDVLTAIVNQEREERLKKQREADNSARAELDRFNAEYPQLSEIINSAAPSRERLAAIYRDIKLHSEALEAELQLNARHREACAAAEHLGEDIPTCEFTSGPRDDADKCLLAMRGNF
jgi:hypothetical protein